MLLEILIVSIILMALAFIAIAVRYYNAKSAPSCSRIDDDGNCVFCGTVDEESCQEENSR